MLCLPLLRDIILPQHQWARLLHELALGGFPPRVPESNANANSNL